MTNHFEDKKSEFDPGEEFIKSGGKILESHPNGRPARWKCGKGENGAPIHPKGMIREAVTYINKDGELEGRELDDKYREEMELWRSDWITPKEDRGKREKKEE